MKKLVKTTIVLTTSIFLAACGNITETVSNKTDSSASIQPNQNNSQNQPLVPTPTSDEGSGVPIERKVVDWNLLAPGAKESIDIATAAGDCKLLNELYSEFMAESILPLQNYFNEALTLANCD